MKLKIKLWILSFSHSQIVSYSVWHFSVPIAYSSFNWSAKFLELLVVLRFLFICRLWLKEASLPRPNENLSAIVTSFLLIGIFCIRESGGGTLAWLYSLLGYNSSSIISVNLARSFYSMILKYRDIVSFNSMFEDKVRSLSLAIFSSNFL